LKLQVLSSDVWKICAICTDRGEDPIERLGLSDEDEAVVMALIEHIAVNGTKVLPDNRNHAICAHPKILQLTAGGNLARLPYFYDEGMCIIICDAFKKKGGKSNQTAPEKIKVAVKMYERYFEAKANNQIQWI
jgi:hypothetical protein